jgi:hypothetical protein
VAGLVLAGVNVMINTKYCLGNIDHFWANIPAKNSLIFGISGQVGDFVASKCYDYYFSA